MTSTVQDSGYAWAVAAASFLVLVIQGGLVYSMGVLYIMFQNGLDADGRAVSLVTSLNYSILYLVCPFVGMLTERFGERRLGIVGAIIATLGLVCTSFSTKVYHLYITYGLMSGVGMGLVFNPSTSIIAVYFNKYQKAATGLTVCGNGIGAFIFPPIIKALEDAYGWRGAILIVSGIYAHIIVLCSLYRPIPKNNDSEIVHKLPLRKQNPHAPLRKRTFVNEKDKEAEIKLNGGDARTCRDGDLELNGYSDQGEDEDKQGVQVTSSGNVLDSRNTFIKSLSLFKSVPFLCLCLHSMLTLFPTVLVYTHFGNYVLSLQFTKQDVVLLYMALGITTTLSRVIIGITAEITKANPVIVVSLSAIINGLITIALPYTRDLTLIYVYAVFFAITVSPYNALCLPLTIDSVPRLQVATGYGIVCFFCVPGTAFGAPLAAWLHAVTHVYASSFYLAGVLFILSGLVMLPALWFTKLRAGGRTGGQSCIMS